MGQNQEVGGNYSPVFIICRQPDEASTRTSALLHPLLHLPLQSQAAAGLGVRQRGHALGLASRQLRLLNAAQRRRGRHKPAGCHSPGVKVRPYLLQQLNFGLQDFLHVADLLLPLRQAALQLRLILIGQALRRRPGPKQTAKFSFYSLFVLLPQATVLIKLFSTFSTDVLQNFETSKSKVKVTKCFGWITS